MAAHASRDPLETSIKYRTIKHLGNGAFGSVVLAESSDGQQVAIKLLKRSAMNKYVETEILNHSMLWHPHVSIALVVCMARPVLAAG
jgi:serine/threonine-protein kinase SRK2